MLAQELLPVGIIEARKNCRKCRLRCRGIDDTNLSGAAFCLDQPIGGLLAFDVVLRIERTVDKWCETRT